MKKLLPFLCSACFILSCASVNKSLHPYLEIILNKPISQVLASIHYVLKNEGNIITASHNALIEAHSKPDTNKATGVIRINYWGFLINKSYSWDNTTTLIDPPVLHAHCSARYYLLTGKDKPTFLRAEYPDDNTKSTEQWYWNVRNALESICLNKAVSRKGSYYFTQ